MPIYRAVSTREFTPTGQRFSNVYNLLTGTATDAITTLRAIRNLEQSVSYTIVNFVELSVVNVADKTDRFREQTPGTVGVLDVAGLGGALPLFCTVLITFSDNVGKPEKKFLRVGAQRNNMSLGQWDGDFLDFIDTNYASTLFGSLEYVGPNGERPTNYRISPLVQDRQVGWHRRTRPGFHRGWVAD